MHIPRKCLIINACHYVFTLYAGYFIAQIILAYKITMFMIITQLCYIL